MVNTQHSSSSSSSQTKAEEKTADTVKTSPEHSYKEIHIALNKGNNREQVLDYITDALTGLTGMAPSEQQKKSLKETVNKNLLNKLD